MINFKSFLKKLFRATNSDIETMKIISSFTDYSIKHQHNQDTHPIFREYNWKEWINASPEMHQEMKNKLKDTFGYL